IFVLTTTQYGKAITPTIPIVGLLLHDQMSAESAARGAVGGLYADSLTKEGFAYILDAYTEDNEALVIDPHPNFINAIDALSWWKAVDPGEFKVGANDEYWESAMTHEEAVPPTMGAESAIDMMVPQDVISYPYKEMV
ncbi:MAG: hypothetical protein SGPRY_014212, partial [Prymnesium sp.]